MPLGQYQEGWDGYDQSTSHEVPTGSDSMAAYIAKESTRDRVGGPDPRSFNDDLDQGEEGSPENIANKILKSGGFTDSEISLRLGKI